jgi:hypothetical protein
MKALVRTARVDVADAERARFVATWSGPEHAEAMDAYAAKRPPRWALK